MTISQIVERERKNQGRTKIWIADKLGSNYKTFVDRINKDKLTATEIIGLIDILNLDLDELRKANKLAKENDSK